MKTKANGQPRRVELGRHIVADPKICGGQPTFKGTRIMVWLVLEQLEQGMKWDEIVGEWDGRVTPEAISEAISIADFVVKHEPFRCCCSTKTCPPASGCYCVSGGCNSERLAWTWPSPAPVVRT